MRKAMLLGLALVVSPAFATDAPAQTAPPTPKATDTDRRDADRDRAAWTPDPNSIESKRLLGTKVRTGDGKDVGAIDQIIVNTSDGKISHAIVGMGGLAGIGERKVVVPWSELKLARDDKDRDRMVATIDRAALDRAPRYTTRAADRDRTPAASPATRARPGAADDKKPPERKY